MNDTVLTVAEAAAVLKVSRRTIERAIADRGLRAFKIADRGTWRIRPADLEAWMDSRANTAPTPPVAGAVGVPLVPRRTKTARASGRLAVTPEMGRTA